MNIEKSLSGNNFRFRNACVAAMIAVAATITGNLPFVEAQGGAPQQVSFDGIRNKQFCEILVVKDDGVDIYNQRNQSSRFFAQRVQESNAFQGLWENNIMLL